MSVHSHIETGTALAREQLLTNRLSSGIAPKMLSVYADIHDEILAFASPKTHLATAHRHAEIVTAYCAKQAQMIDGLNEAERNFRTRIAHALDTAEKRAAIIEFARELGAGRSQLKSDQKAFRAYFDADAVVERFHKRVGERERVLAHALERLGIITADALIEDPLLPQSGFFVELSHNLLADMRNWRGDARVRCGAHLCLASIARQISQWPFGARFDQMLSSTRRACLDAGEDLWVQCAAFDALTALSPKSLSTTIEVRIARELPDDKPQVLDNEMFLRRKLVRLLCENYTLDEAFSGLLAKLIKDRNGSVRQMFAGALHLLPAHEAARFFRQLLRDTDPQVRSAIFADVPRLLAVIDHEAFAAHIALRLGREDDSFVLRVLLDAASVLAQECIALDPDVSGPILTRLTVAISAFQSRGVSPKLLRWADEANERVWLASDADALNIARSISAVTSGQREAEIRTAKQIKQWLKEDSDKVGRVMAVLAQNDFGLSLETGNRPKIQRGEWIRRRLWRILFEGFNSATDKRQAFLHTTGRDYFGTMLAPSARMAELAPTKVPGEPLFESLEGGWRNYLPLVDQVLAALDNGQTITIFTSAGMTRVSPPQSLASRLRCYWNISRGFPKLAGKRNRAPADYLEALRAMGITVAFRRYAGNEAVNPHITALMEAHPAAVAPAPRPAPIAEPATEQTA